MSLVQYVKASGNTSNTYCVSTGAPLLDSAPNLQIGDTTVETTVTTTDPCKKEPVIKSSKFRLADRPGTDQYFEDDGFGNLVTYYISGNRKVITNPKAGTVDYTNGTICFGPVNVVGSGGDTPDLTPTGEIDDAQALVGTEFNIAIQSIPSNPSVIYTPDPGSIIEIIVPSISVSPLGTNLPPTVPLNSLTPEIFEVVPPIVEIPDISNNGNLANISCFNS